MSWQAAHSCSRIRHRMPPRAFKEKQFFHPYEIMRPPCATRGTIFLNRLQKSMEAERINLTKNLCLDLLERLAELRGYL